MRARCWFSAAAVVALSLWAAVPAAHAAFPGANGKIAYGFCGASDCGIFVVGRDGSGATQITHNPYSMTSPEGVNFPLRDYGPAWTADGKTIAYTRRLPAGGFELRLVKPHGSGDTALGVPGENPAWSPDSTKIAYTGYLDDGYPRVFVVNSDGTDATPITGARASDPEWSPDGSRIVFAQSVDPFEASSIWTMNPDGSGQMRLTFDEGVRAFLPAWSPSGNEIAFTRSFQGRQYEVYSMDANGANQVNLTNNEVGPPTFTRIDDEDPAWSPDGKRIAFVRTSPDPPSQIFVMNAIGGGDRALVPGGTQPAWQPLHGPQRSDYKNASQFCKAERDFLGDERFRERYGSGANAHGKCVGQNS